MRTAVTMAKGTPIANAVTEKAVKAPQAAPNVPYPLEFSDVAAVTESTEPSVNEPVTESKVEGVSSVVEKVPAESQPAATLSLVKASDSLLKESPPPQVAVHTAAAPVVKSEDGLVANVAAVTEASTGNVAAKKEHGSEEDHDEENCQDECCTESRGAIDDMTNSEREYGVDPLEITHEEKSRTRSPESADMSHSSSCSDEVKKNADVVRISSC